MEVTGSPHIGTLRERPLHAALKEWCSRPGDHLEARIDGYVVDVARKGLLIEVQTKSFSKMRNKAETLLEAGHRLRLLYPIAERKWIVKLGEGGEIIDRRRSPRRGAPFDLFAELVSFPTLLDDPLFEIEVVLTHEDELRVHVPGKAWRRKGWTILERQLVEVVGTVRIGRPEDLLTLIPHSLPTTFTTADLAATFSRQRRIAQQAAYCLRETGVIVATGKEGNAIQYQLA